MSLDESVGSAITFGSDRILATIASVGVVTDWEWRASIEGVSGALIFRTLVSRIAITP